MMKKLFLSLFPICMFSVAHAQPVMSRGGGISAPGADPSYKISPDGTAHFSNIDGKTQVNGVPLSSLVANGKLVAPVSGDLSNAQLGSRTLGDAVNSATATATAAQTMAASAVPAAHVGMAGGVAALDSLGRVLAPVAGDASAAQLDSDTTGAQAASRLKAAEGAVTSLQGTVADQEQKLSAASSLASSALPASRVGTAGGVASLDSGGRITAPVAGDASSAQLDSDTTGAQAVARLKTVESGVTGLQNTVADHAGKLTTATTIASGAASAVTTEATRAKAAEQ
ncbi:MAG: hypothetical protein LKH03_11975, partial [Acetobacter sp.]|nr:hypothetical protein [Acetobacter sp.]